MPSTTLTRNTRYAHWTLRFRFAVKNRRFRLLLVKNKNNVLSVQRQFFHFNFRPTCVTVRFGRYAFQYDSHTRHQFFN